MIQFTAKMKTVVVGGHSRNIGKTSVMAGLIRAMKSFDWTAVKITQYGHGICSHDGEPCGCAPTEHAFVLTEERDTAGRGDTSRFLFAGARRALWLRVRQGRLVEAFPLLERAWGKDDWVMIESNSILSFMEPSLYLVVLDSSQGDFKPSALEHLERADALVPIGPRVDDWARIWPFLDPKSIENKPRFPLAAGKYCSSKLNRFVRQRLLASAENLPGDRGTQSSQKKEQLCQH